MVVLHWADDCFYLSCLLIWFDLRYYFSFCPIYFRLRDICITQGFYRLRRIGCFFCFISVESWPLTYAVSLLASGFAAFLYCFFIVGWETNFLDCLLDVASWGDPSSPFLVVDFLLPDVIVFILASDLHLLMAGLMKY